MMWVIRAGQKSIYYDKYLKESKVYIPWDGYRMNLGSIMKREDYRSIVEKEKGVNNRTSVSNWAGQLYSFAKEMKKGDYVLIPSKGSRLYCLATIVGDYCFDKDEKDKLYHSHDIKVLENDVPREVFSQAIVYSLGTFRTIFKVKQEEEIMQAISKWKEG